MIWVSADDVIALHSKIIKKTGGIDGVRDRSGLEAAVAAPLQSFGGEDFYQTTIDKIARLGYGLAANHSFIDGNKRIGALMTQLLLQWNGYRLVLNRGELADMFIAIADGSAGEIELLDWINKRIHR
ncbi:type II toxin-antitoxin system death-on-curing family toxin [Phascolarctobacterium succinatutens]|uniref:type II toxin-antitoxin system death-on-curing family toxin n=1 Tax=Phascolarctobacterium succinatutens TaxID=626940 RepID=UPI00402983EA